MTNHDECCATVAYTVNKIEDCEFRDRRFLNFFSLFMNDFHYWLTSNVEESFHPISMKFNFEHLCSEFEDTIYLASLWFYVSKIIPFLILDWHRKNSSMDSISHNEIKIPGDTIDFLFFIHFQDEWIVRIKCRTTNRMRGRIAWISRMPFIITWHKFFFVFAFPIFKTSVWASIAVNSYLFLWELNHFNGYLYLRIYCHKMIRSNWRILNYLREIETIMR